MATVAAPPVVVHRDDDLVLKGAFGGVFSLDESMVQAVTLLHAKRTNNDSVRVPGKRQRHELPRSPTSANAASFRGRTHTESGQLGSAEGLYPSYLVCVCVCWACVLPLTFKFGCARLYPLCCPRLVSYWHD